MAKGDVYYHANFPFHDDSFGQKLFVVLNDPEGNEPYLVVKTTSNLRNRTYTEGCNPKDGVFYISERSGTTFPKATLIQLIEIFEFSREEFLKGSLKDKIISFKESLSSLIVAQIINCVRRLKDDIGEKHFKMITRGERLPEK